MRETLALDVSVAVLSVAFARNLGWCFAIFVSALLTCDATLGHQSKFLRKEGSALHLVFAMHTLALIGQKRSCDGLPEAKRRPIAPSQYSRRSNVTCVEKPGCCDTQVRRRMGYVHFGTQGVPCENENMVLSCVCVLVSLIVEVSDVVCGDAS